MEKLIYLLHKPAEQKISVDFTRRGNSVIVPRLKSVGACNIVFTPCDLTDEVRQAAPARVLGHWESIAGAFHLWLDNLDDRPRIELILRQFTADISGYLVTESVVQRAPRTWQDGERRPGVTQLAILHKSPAVSDEEFYHNWHIGHSPETFLIHPWRLEYVRNAVVRVLTPGAQPYRIIVLEQFGELRDYTDESRYFGSPDVMKEVYTGAVFADWETRIIGPASEYTYA